MKRIHVATGIIYNDKQQILIAERLPGQHLAGFWEFPGGKLEENETVLMALKRELKEEINIDVLAAEPFTQIEFDYPEKKVLLDVWRVLEFSGIAIGREGQKIVWAQHDELKNYAFPPVNLEIIHRLFTVAT